MASPADIVIYGGGAGGGKMVPLDTLVPVPSGWTTIGQLEVGDELFSETGEICKVVRLFDIVDNPVLYRFTFDDSSTIDSCKDHLWQTTKSVLTTQKIVDTLIDRHEIPLTKPLVCQRVSSDVYELAVAAGQKVKNQQILTGNTRTIVKAIRIRPRPSRCIQVSSPSHLFLIGKQMVPTHNSYALLLEPLRHVINNPEYTAIFFRRNTTQIKNPGGLWDESLKIYSQLGGRSIQYSSEWLWEGGGKIKFSHLEHDSTVYSWQGSALAFLAFDELCHFTETQFWYMLSRNRSVCGVRPYVRATVNPDADSWVARLIEWWIDQDSGFPIYERSGVLRYFIRLGDALIWGDSVKELVDEHGPEVVPKSLTFIPAKLSDNKKLTDKDPNYKANLMALSRVERGRLLDGNWKIRPAAGMYFKRQEVTMIDELPDDIVKIFRAWDLAATEKTPDNPDPDYTVGVKIGLRKNKKYVIIDVIRERINAGAVRDLVCRTAVNDGIEVKISIPQDPGQAGKAQAQSYTKDLSGFFVETSTESGDKVVRAEPFAAQWQHGNIEVMRGFWNDAFFTELEAFPSKCHDDQVDASSRGFAMLATSNLSVWSALGR